MTALQPAPWVAQFLRRIGIETPDHDDNLHRRLVDAVFNLGPGATLGQRIVAVKYVVRDEHGKAGRRFATARADHEDAVLARKIDLLQDESWKGSATLAKDIAEHDAIDQRRVWLLAEQEERTLRKFLETIESDLENHRTDRADVRAGDRAEAHGLGGGL